MIIHTLSLRVTTPESGGSTLWKPSEIAWVVTKRSQSAMTAIRRWYFAWHSSVIGWWVIMFNTSSVPIHNTAVVASTQNAETQLRTSKSCSVLCFWCFWQRLYEELKYSDTKYNKFACKNEWIQERIHKQESSIIHDMSGPIRTQCARVVKIAKLCSRCRDVHILSCRTKLLKFLQKWWWSIGPNHHMMVATMAIQSHDTIHRENGQNCHFQHQK